MRHLALSLFVVTAVAVLCISAAPSPKIPAKFLAEWQVDKSDNFDNYLSAKGYGFFMRQIVKLASITKIFSKNSDGSYNCKILTTKKNVEWNFQLNKEFQAEYLDDSQHNITFSYDPATDKLFEKHVPVEDPTKVDIYEYKINSESYLVMHMEYDGVATDRYYKRIQ